MQISILSQSWAAVLKPVLSRSCFDNIKIKRGQFCFSSIVGEFDLFLRVEIGCILDFETEITEAAEVVFAINELIAAMNLRIGLQQEDEDKNKETGDVIRIVYCDHFRTIYLWLHVIRMITLLIYFLTLLSTIEHSVSDYNKQLIIMLHPKLSKAVKSRHEQANKSDRFISIQIYFSRIKTAHLFCFL